VEAPYQTPIEAQPSEREVKALRERRCGDVERAGALETHWVPWYRPHQWVRPRVNSGSLEPDSGEGQSCGSTRARERNCWSENKRGTNQAEGLPGRTTTMRSGCSMGTLRKFASSRSYPWVWLQLDVGLASLVPRQDIRNASREKGFLFFIM